ncbi:MAG: hypothetical protein JW882_21715 [Deltaproteobacteria bacterium]|nr:hypothetical protein [Deltaproteobacteria bacterium]
MKKFISTTACLAVLITLIIGSVILKLKKKESLPALPISAEKQNSSPMVIRGFDANSYYHEKLVSRVRADELKIIPRKFYIFNIRPFNEFVLTNSRIEIYIDPDILEDNNEVTSSNNEYLLPDLSDIFSSNSKNIGIITQGIVNGLIFEIYINENLFYVVRAKEAQVDIKKKQAELVDVSIEETSARRMISANYVIWDDQEKSFIIPGEYRVVSDTLRAMGKGIKLDFKYDLNSIL